MNAIFDAYYKMFDKKIKNLIKEDNDDWSDDTDTDENKEDKENKDDNADDWSDDSSDDSSDEEFTSDDSDKSDSSNADNISDTEEKSIKGAELKFSADLASEFGKTCNKFTNLAVKAVKQRTVDTETAKELTTILDKLQSLLDVAKQS